MKFGDMLYNMNEPWKHDAKWKKPVTKNHIVYDSIYMRCSDRQIYGDRKQIHGSLELKGIGVSKVTAMG